MCNRSQPYYVSNYKNAISMTMMRLFPCLLLLVAPLQVASQLPAALLELHRHEIVNAKERGAVCNDGSPGTSMHVQTAAKAVLCHWVTASLKSPTLRLLTPAAAPLSPSHQHRTTSATAPVRAPSVPLVGALETSGSSSSREGRQQTHASTTRPALCGSSSTRSE